LVITDHQQPNLQHLKNLKELATGEMAQQELKKKLHVVDNEVRDLYRKLNAAKQKKKCLTQEEVAQAWKCLKERELLLEQIYNM
jgi:Histone acetyltransferases subunit 3.